MMIFLPEIRNHGTQFWHKEPHCHFEPATCTEILADVVMRDVQLLSLRDKMSGVSSLEHSNRKGNTILSVLYFQLKQKDFAAVVVIITVFVEKNLCTQ